MSIKNTVATIFEKIAERLKTEYQDKEKTNLEYSDVGINPTAIGSSTIANIVIDDSETVVDGNNPRAEKLREILDYYSDDLQTLICEVSLATGDCIARPYTDGENIGIMVVSNDDFVITESIGDNIKAVIMKLAEYSIDKNKYRLFESQRLMNVDGTSVCQITRYAYCEDKEIPLSETDWKSFEESVYITANQLLIGRYKCPTINRDNYNSNVGVPITYGCNNIIEEIQKKYQQYNEEFEIKKSRIFADRTLFKRDSNDNSLSLSQKNEFVLMRGDMNNGLSSMMQEYSPTIRENEYKAGADFNFGVLELCCGFSRGVFTAPETSFATATEMKNSLKKTFAFVKKVRRKIEQGDKMLFNAIDIILNLNNVTPVGEWTLRHQWSYDYVEQAQEHFNELISAHSVGAVKTSDVTAWVLDMDKEKAEEYVKEIQASGQEISNEAEEVPSEEFT